jgi:hypothetical protein
MDRLLGLCAKCVRPSVLHLGDLGVRVAGGRR